MAYPNRSLLRTQAKVQGGCSCLAGVSFLYAVLQGTRLLLPVALDSLRTSVPSASSQWERKGREYERCWRNIIAQIPKSKRDHPTSIICHWWKSFDLDAKSLENVVSGPEELPETTHTIKVGDVALPYPSQSYIYAQWQNEVGPGWGGSIEYALGVKTSHSQGSILEIWSSEHF